MNEKIASEIRALRLLCDSTWRELVQKCEQLESANFDSRSAIKLVRDDYESRIEELQEQLSLAVAGLLEIATESECDWSGNLAGRTLERLR